MQGTSRDYGLIQWQLFDENILEILWKTGKPKAKPNSLLWLPLPTPLTTITPLQSEDSTNEEQGWLRWWFKEPE